MLYKIINNNIFGVVRDELFPSVSPTNNVIKGLSPGTLSMQDTELDRQTQCTSLLDGFSGKVRSEAAAFANSTIEVIKHADRASFDSALQAGFESLTAHSPQSLLSVAYLTATGKSNFCASVANVVLKGQSEQRGRNL